MAEADLSEMRWPSIEEWDHPRLKGPVKISDLIREISNAEHEDELHIDPNYTEVVPADDVRGLIGEIKLALTEEGGASLADRVNLVDHILSVFFPESQETT